MYVYDSVSREYFDTMYISLQPDMLSGYVLTVMYRHRIEPFTFGHDVAHLRKTVTDLFAQIDERFGGTFGSAIEEAPKRVYIYNDSNEIDPNTGLGISDAAKRTGRMVAEALADEAQSVRPVQQALHMTEDDYHRLNMIATTYGDDDRPMLTMSQMLHDPYSWDVYVKDVLPECLFVLCAHAEAWKISPMLMQGVIADRAHALAVHASEISKVEAMAEVVKIFDLMNSLKLGGQS